MLGFIAKYRRGVTYDYQESVHFPNGISTRRRSPMNAITNNAARKAVASIPIWFVVFLIVVFGGFTLGSSEDWRWTTLGAVLLAIAAVLSALILSVRGKGRRAGC
jgi:hypothetical protein